MDYSGIRQLIVHPEPLPIAGSLAHITFYSREPASDVTLLTLHKVLSTETLFTILNVATIQAKQGLNQVNKMFELNLSISVIFMVT